MNDEPLGLRIARFFLFTALLLFVLFLLSDYSGYPRLSWLFWSLVLFLVGYVMRQRYRTQYREGVALHSPPQQKEEKRDKEAKGKASRSPRFRLRRKRRS